MQHDGNGWVDCRCGRSHWGRFGAAGLLLISEHRLLLQLRSEWVHLGGTWSTPGGARDSHESIEMAALREANEEHGIHAEDVELLATFPSIDHVDWAYHYVVARPRDPHALDVVITAESAAVAWVGLDELTTLPLHPGFAASWPDTLPRLKSLSEWDDSP